MQVSSLVKISEFCFHHNVNESFVNLLAERELINITLVKNTQYIHYDYLPTLEKIIRLHNELDINVEGIEAILHLTDKIIALQQEVCDLKNLLKG
ncbi:chaperone modulator CbpM [Abyssalbus ytuae]|uniref:Chaperone modulator CbpM n=1 Tax=Abyssalbus ytuae TaxID=2926907 RepID=A0A9E6ZXU3_9FLAO|nr:chaperone modulator CbpM [Abyssalbus ytuae]UOB18901.1 chaperone modulator CbpM [Abyssalbus ytuae]